MDSALAVLMIVATFNCRVFGEQTSSVDKRELENNIFLLDKSGCNGRLSPEDCDKLLGRSKWYYIKHFKKDWQCSEGLKMTITLTLNSKITITENLLCPEERYNIFPLANLATNNILNRLGITFRLDIGKSGQDAFPIIVVPGERWEIPEKDTWDHGTKRQRDQRLEVVNNICQLKEECTSLYGFKYDYCKKLLSDATKYYLQTYQWKKEEWKRCTANTLFTSGTKYGIPCEIPCPRESFGWNNLALTDQVLKSAKRSLNNVNNYEDIEKVLNIYPGLQLN